MIATSSTPSTRSGPSGRRPRAGISGPAGSATPAAAVGRRLSAVLLGLGLAALVGLTTWAVASVSLWLVPAYLTLLILIFAAPEAGSVKSRATGPTTGPSDADVALSGRDTGSDRADGREQLPPVSESSPDIPAGEDAGSSATRVDPAGPPITKPRRSRARSRKASRTAAEPAPDSSPVTWIRVGPGQFVRSDGPIPVPPQATAEEVTHAAPPATDEPSSVTPDPELVLDVDPMIDGLASVPSVLPSTAPLEVSTEPILHDLPEPSPEGAGIDPSTGENPPEPSAEEYGIAPSAFGPETGDSLSSPSLDPGVPDASVAPIADPGPTAELDGPPSDGDVTSVRPGSPRQRSWARTASLLRGIANVSRAWGPDATSSRRGLRTRPGPRAAYVRRSAKDLRLRQAARRAGGRTAHVQRDWRPRSPPRHAS